MCGIAGAYHFDDQPIIASVLEAMTKCIAHRGPDDSGTEIFSLGNTSVGLGNRRLKIIDLSSAGHMPMTSADGRLWVTFNGEIYNYIELRQELTSLGRKFRTHTDTEVILEAFAQWGEDCFKRFNGMWAIALYNKADGSMILCRDRWGVKPLFVYRDDKRLVFGSEIKALLRHPNVPKQPNYRTIYNYVARHYRWVDGGRDTFYEGIENLRPARYLKVMPNGTVTEKRYWDLSPIPAGKTLKDEEVLARFRELFEDAVKIRLRSDVPVASMLSGGLDSSSVTCMAAKLSSKPVTTFSARYAEADFDEGPYIEETIKHIKADGRFIHPKPGELLETLNTMLSYHDEPVCTVTWFAHWLIMADVAKMGFPVLLNGHAGDELFAGYWGHYLYNFADLEKSDPQRFQQEYDSWMGHHKRDPQEYPRFKAQLAEIEAGRMDSTAPLSQYAHTVLPEFKAHYASIPDRPNPFKGKGILIEHLYDDAMYQTIPAMLRPEDRNSMAFSIETRSPFLDFRLAEYAFTLPNQFKIRNGLGKWTVREGMKGILPEKVRTRTDKQGFNAPTLHWYRSHSRDVVRDILASPSLAARGILNQEEVLRCFDDHVEGKANHYLAIWQWLNLELWMRLVFDDALVK